MIFWFSLSSSQLQCLSPLGYCALLCQFKGVFVIFQNLLSMLLPLSIVLMPVAFIEMAFIDISFFISRTGKAAEWGKCVSDRIKVLLGSKVPNLSLTYCLGLEKSCPRLGQKNWATLYLLAVPTVGQFFPNFGQFFCNRLASCWAIFYQMPQTSLF